MKIQPKNGYMLVRSEKKLETAAGILLPVESDDEAQTTFAVVVIPPQGLVESAKSPGLKDHFTPEYEVGDVVLFSKLVPDDVVIEDENGKKQTLWFVKVSSIKGVIKQ